MNTKPAQKKQTRADVIFNAILAKNQLARHGNVTVEGLLDIEEALALAMRMIGFRDNQPSAKDCMNQTVV
jgi:hypothetical protein